MVAGLSSHRLRSFLQGIEFNVLVISSKLECLLNGFASGRGTFVIKYINKHLRIIVADRALRDADTSLVPL